MALQELLITLTYKRTSLFLLAIVIVVIAVIYALFNPEDCKFFPPCPIYHFTGFKCPGCGSQRAIHYLLNGDIIGAFSKNALAVIAIPYIILGLWLDYKKNLSLTLLRWRKTLYGRNAIWVVLSIIIVFTIARNILGGF